MAKKKNEMTPENSIRVFNACEHNLKGIDLQIPKNKLIVFTGLSGSGKSTLAFDTLYAEGQRRYIESLSSYARQFLDKVGKPDVERIEGLTPAIAIDQKTTSKNPRSTVGTITEVYDYFRLLYARLGKQHCHKCGKPISSMSAQDVIDQVLNLPENSKLVVLSPLVNRKKGTFADLLEKLRNKGYVRAMIDGVMVRLDEETYLEKNKIHTIKVVIDRLVVKEENKTRIGEAVEKGLNESFGEIEVEVVNHEEMGTEKLIHFSEHMACFDCKISFEPLEPLTFSFNSPKGACSTCDGLGINFEIDLKKIIDNEKSINKGGIKPFFGYNKSFYSKMLLQLCEQRGIDIYKSVDELDEKQRDILLNGDGEVFSFIWKRHNLTRTWEGVKKVAYDMLKGSNDLEEYMTEKTCSSCNGHRLKPSSLSVLINDKNLGEIIDMSIEDCHNWFNDDNNFKNFTEQEHMILKPVLKEIKERVFFLYDVGLGYISLGRDARTISGGEAQRIRVASQIGSGLTGVMYVLDEPSIGLHERDTFKLIKTLKNLRDKGNTVIVVEHDKETIMEADYIVDIGPKAGVGGGNIVFVGTYEELMKKKTLTSDYLSGRKKIDFRENRKREHFIQIKNVNINNIKKLNVKIPLRNLVAITGVSGSGKSSLILHTLLPVARELLNRAKNNVKGVEGVEIQGLENLDKVIYLDQSPIGRTPRSNPATYTGVMDDIRQLFSKTKEANLRGYQIGRFSFNVKGGRCEKCQGEGELKIEMHFLPDIMVECDSCKGQRYNAQTLEIEIKGKNISDVLKMTVEDAHKFFEKVPKIKQKLETLVEVGLGYITLGQNAVTLSGGEAQRIKLAKELSKRDTGNTLYVLDEPTTGLHFADVDRLTGVLHRLTDLGNSVLVIEHNLDVIKNADWVIDMGPEGGKGGGKIVAQGTPEKIAKDWKKTGSYTGKYLLEELKELDKK